MQSFLNVVQQSKHMQPMILEYNYYAQDNKKNHGDTLTQSAGIN